LDYYYITYQTTLFIKFNALVKFKLISGLPETGATTGFGDQGASFGKYLAYRYIVRY